MTFRFEGGQEFAVDFGMTITWASVIIVFAIPVFIFWRAQTRIFFLMFSGALFFLSLPVFYEFLSALYIFLISSGCILIGIASWKGYVSKKMTILLFGGYTLFGVSIFSYVFFIMDETPLRARGTGAVGDTSPFILIFILIGIGAIFFYLYQKYDIFKYFEINKEEEQTIEKDITSTLQKTISEISEGKDIRSTILKCYKQMCLILEKEGISNEDYMTPREFEKAANEKLNVTSSHISRIREIFELARYSSHELKEKDKDDVIDDLKALRDDIK